MSLFVIFPIRLTISASAQYFSPQTGTTFSPGLPSDLFDVNWDASRSKTAVRSASILLSSNTSSLSSPPLLLLLLQLSPTGVVGVLTTARRYSGIGRFGKSNWFTRRGAISILSSQFVSV